MLRPVHFNYSDRVTGVPVLVHDSRQFIAPNKSSAAREVGEFKCPECQKTCVPLATAYFNSFSSYSCRKNVKRHRMAVHKLSADDINRFPGPAPCPHAVAGDASQLSPSLPKILSAIRGEKPEYSKSESLSPNFREKAFSEFQVFLAGEGWAITIFIGYGLAQFSGVYGGRRPQWPSNYRGDKGTC